MAKYVKRPIPVDAVQWKRPGDHPAVVEDKHGHFVKTLEGMMRVNPGDYIITGVAGENYPVKREIFEATYERVRQGAG